MTNALVLLSAFALYTTWRYPTTAPSLTVAAPLRQIPDSTPLSIPSVIESSVIESSAPAPIASGAARTFLPTIQVSTSQQAAIDDIEGFSISAVTENAPGYLAKLPLATAEPVAFIDVQPGDRVEKGWQVFSHWESPERLQVIKVRLDRAKQLQAIAADQLEVAKRNAQRAHRLRKQLSGTEVDEIINTLRVRKKELAAATLRVSEAENRFEAENYEFKQSFVTSPIAGYVESVDIALGERRQVGGPFRGVTIVNVDKVYARGWLTFSDVDLFANTLKQNQCAALSDGVRFKASVVMVGRIADSTTNQLPIVVEIENPEQKLRIGQVVKLEWLADKVDGREE